MFKQKWPYLVLAFACVIGIVWLTPPVQGLQPAGKASLAVAVFAIIVWVTQAVDDAMSGLLIVFLLASCWVLMPFDIVPDAIPLVGAVDDVIVMTLAGWPLARLLEQRIDQRRRRGLSTSTGTPLVGDERGAYCQCRFRRGAPLSRIAAPSPVFPQLAHAACPAS